MTYERYVVADNMMDKIVVLSVFSGKDCDECIKVIDVFYVEWLYDLFVMNKWFSI